MIQTETDMRNWLKAKMKHTPMHVKRIETGATELGIPDLYCFCNGGDGNFWIESKIVSAFTSRSFKVPWRPGQLTVGRELILAEINLWLLICAKRTQELVLIPGRLWQKYYNYQELCSVSLITMFKPEVHTPSLYSMLTKNQYE
jgi:hypothetical protein